MDAAMMMVSTVAFAALVFTLVGGPIVVVNWVRSRRETVIARQIELTDALDGRFGAIVAPVVARPLLGLWEVRIAVPFLRPALLSQVLSVIDDVFADGEAMPSSAYRISLIVAKDVQRAASDHKAKGRGEQWEQAPGCAV